MAETEPVVEAQPERERNTEPFVYDESLLILVKGKVQQPKQPEHTESRLLIQKLQAEITKRGDRIKEIKGIEEQLRSSAKGASVGNRDVLVKLKELRDQKGTIIRQKAAIRDELHSSDGARESIRNEMRSIRDKNRNINLEKIEQEIRDLEFKLAHESLPEQDEKRATTLLQQLTAARPFAKKYAEFDGRLKEGELQRAAIIARLKEADSVIAGLDGQIATASAVLDESKSKADATTADIPTLQVEKKENYEIMVMMRAKIDELRKKNDEEYAEYIKRDKAYYHWKREQNRKKFEERQKEREERELQRSEENRIISGDVTVEPFSQEIFTCEQLLTYLRSFTVVKEEVKEEAKAVEVPAGLKPFKRVEVVDDMFTGVPKRAPPVKAGKAAPAPAPVKAAEPAKPRVQKLNHTLDMLKVFLGLNVEPPISTSAIPATIEKVEERKAEFKEKAEVAKRAPPPSRARAAAPAAAANGGKHEEEEAKEEEAAPEPEATPEPEAAAEPEPEAATSAAPEPEVEAEPSSSPAAAEAAAEEPAASKAEPVVEIQVAAKEAVKEAPAAPAPAAKGGALAGTGVDVTLKVTGNKVSLSVRAA